MVKALNGLRDGLPIVVGYLPAGMTFGILAREAGVMVSDTVGFSAIVFAGASQYMAINLIATGAATLQIIAATFLLNFRHFLMSATLTRRLEEQRVWPRMLLAFGVTDETFAIASVRPTFSGTYMGALNLVAWLSWQTGTITGYLAGSFLPPAVGTAMGVALYALFAALLAPILRANLIRIIPAVAAALMHIALRELTEIPLGWSFVLAVVAAAAVGSVVPETNREKQ